MSTQKVLQFPHATDGDDNRPREPLKPSTRYVELAVASNFSFLRGASSPEELIGQSAYLGYAGLGLCDRNTVAGVVRAHLAKRENELKLRYHPGARLVFADGTPDILAYPRDRAGWGRLCRLLTRGNLRAEKGECILTLDDLLEWNEGLELIVMPESTRTEPAKFLHHKRTSFAEDIESRECAATSPLASPPPLRGRDREGGEFDPPSSSLPPSPTLPRKGGGSRLRQAARNARAGGDQSERSPCDPLPTPPPEREREPTVRAAPSELAPPSPLWGGSANAEGGSRGGGASTEANTPTPNPSPQGGGEPVGACEEASSKIRLRLISFASNANEENACSCRGSTHAAKERSRKKVQISKSDLLRRLREAAPGRVRLAASMLYRGNDRARLAARAKLAREADVPLIAVNDVLYHHFERRALQDVLICIREHVTIDTAGRRLAANAERYLKFPDEMARLFGDAPEAIEETLRLSEALTFSLDDLTSEYPEEKRAGFASPQQALEHFTWEGAAKRYPKGVPHRVQERLAHEFKLIASRDYAPFFLTVHHIVQFARSQEILCQGRGSAANSAVCYCLGITEVNPDEHQLLFERFISENRGEPPDIDVDFEHERREEVIQHIYEHYGRAHTGIAATVISYRGRSAIREIGKAFGLSEDMIGALASSIWGMGGGMVRLDALRAAGLDPQSPRVAKIIALAREIQGFPRHLSQHVGGFVITRSRLDEVVPIMNGAMDKRTHIEWDKDDLDALNLLKVDVLGLGMLTCIRKALDLVARHYPEAFADRTSRSVTSFAELAETTEPASQASPPPLRGRDRERGRPHALSSPTPPSPPLPRKGGWSRLRQAAKLAARNQSKSSLNLSHIPQEQPAVYDMLCRADSIGVFQVESRAQMSMLPRLRPRRFYDLVIEVAIVRPGPIQGDMVHPYLRRRQGIERPDIPSPSRGDKNALVKILKRTLGVPLFQEQAMKIAIDAGGFTPAEADKLRRAMATFKRTGTIDKFRSRMVEGMKQNGYEPDFAERCFKQIEGFGEYGFPESHAASFALLVYASAWLKCRYPDVFAAALLNSQPMGFYAPAQIVRDVREHGVAVRPVDINFSDYDVTLEPGPHAARRVHALHRAMKGDIRATHALRLGFRAVKGLSEEDARPIAERRRSSSEARCKQEETEGAAASPLPTSGKRRQTERAADSELLSPPPERGRSDCEAVREGVDQLHARNADPLPTPPPCRGRERTERAAKQLPDTTTDVPYVSIRDLWLRTGLSPRVLERLADADAFGSLGLTRRQALWAVKALGRAGDQDDLPLQGMSSTRITSKETAESTACSITSPLAGEVDRAQRGREGGALHAQHLQLTPLPTPPQQGGREQTEQAATLLSLSAFRGREQTAPDESNVSKTNIAMDTLHMALSRQSQQPDSGFREPDVALPVMPLGEEVVNDYRFLSLSLRAHPASFLRADLARRRIVTNETLRILANGAYTRVSGLITVRQRPGSANGVIFMTIEDETGIANIIVWPPTFERYRAIVMGARYVAVTGKMQKENEVIHVVADRLDDLTPVLARLSEDAAPPEALARADAVKRPHAEDRPKPRQPGLIPSHMHRHPRSEAVQIAADLGIHAPGSAHTPTRRGTRK